MIRIGIVACSERGGRLAGRLLAAFQDRETETGEKLEAEGYLPGRYRMEGLGSFAGLYEITGRLFRTKDILLFVGACGIAVRAIAPYIESKLTDPGVLAVDECGTFVVSLLSGHVGGANAFAGLVAHILDAVPVITTATDRNGVFAVDEWAVRHGLRIMDPRAAAEISVRLLAGERVGFFSTLPVSGKLPEGLLHLTDPENSEPKAACRDGVEAVIVAAGRCPKWTARFPVLCHLLPMDLVVGMGCRRGKSFAELEAFLYSTLERYHLPVERVGLLCSVDAKSGEEGLQKLAASLGVPFRTFTAEQLSGAPGRFASSDFTLSHMGVDNVCERSACLGSGAGRRLVDKQSGNGITLAVCERTLHLGFETRLSI